ncbi:MAG: hypothetical protein CM15mV25_0640 [uncultured marine virus]|nr:MAG: hypothetical protein CM15mV25_0640 [uncultured marine virus]
MILLDLQWLQKQKGFATTYLEYYLLVHVQVTCVQGVVTISLTADQTKVMKRSLGFDVVATHTDSTVTRLLEGIAIVTPSVVKLLLNIFKY